MTPASSWRDKFQEGVVQFHQANFNAAIELFSEAAALKPDENTIYDSRAASYEKLNRFSDALADSKRVIDLSPQAVKGYHRAARLFIKIKRPQAALKMAALAQARLKESDHKRSDDLRDIERQANELFNLQQRRASETAYHFGKLPVEIASNVFSLIVENLGSGTAVTISHVCHNWRTIALSTPGLWRSLTLSSVTPARKIDAWLERSGGILTELCVKDTFWLSQQVARKFDALPWNRLTNLELDVSDEAAHVDDQLPRIFSYLDLGSFTLRCNHRFGIVERGPAYWTPIEDLVVSRISSLDLDTPILPWTFLGSFTSLVKLSLTTSTSDHAGLINFVDVLKNNPALESITIDVAWDNFTLDHPRIPMPALTHLELGGRLWDPYSLLSLICAPALSVLRIGRDLRCTQAGLIDVLLAYPITGLTELALRCPAFPVPALGALLRSAPRLARLKMTSMMFNCVPSPNDVLEALTARPLLCPQLQAIDFSQCDALEAGPLMRFVKARLPQSQPGAEENGEEEGGAGDSADAPKRILSMTIDACPRVDSNILPWLRVNVPQVSCVYMKKREARHGRWV